MTSRRTTIPTALPGYDYAALDGKVSFPEGATSVIVPVQPNEINHAGADMSVTVILDTEDWIPVPLTETPPTATLNIVNTDVETAYRTGDNYGVQVSSSVIKMRTRHNM